MEEYQRKGIIEYYLIGIEPKEIAWLSRKMNFPLTTKEVRQVIKEYEKEKAKQPRHSESDWENW